MRPTSVAQKIEIRVDAERFTVVSAVHFDSVAHVFLSLVVLFSMDLSHLPEGSGSIRWAPPFGDCLRSTAAAGPVDICLDPSGASSSLSRCSCRASECSRGLSRRRARRGGGSALCSLKPRIISLVFAVFTASLLVARVRKGLRRSPLHCTDTQMIKNQFHTVGTVPTHSRKKKQHSFLF